MPDTDDLATMVRVDNDYIETNFSRLLSHDPVSVWSALTEEGNLPLWLAPGTIDMWEGGAAKIKFTDSGIVIDSTVTALDPGHLIEYSWSAPGEPLRPLRWQLSAAPDGLSTRVDLTLSTPASEDTARTAAGWEAHLEMLAAALEGVPIKFPFERFKAAREAYKARVPA